MEQSKGSCRIPRVRQGFLETGRRAVQFRPASVPLHPCFFKKGFDHSEWCFLLLGSELSWWLRFCPAKPSITKPKTLSFRTLPSESARPDPRTPFCPVPRFQRLQSTRLAPDLASLRPLRTGRFVPLLRGLPRNDRLRWCRSTVDGAATGERLPRRGAEAVTSSRWTVSRPMRSVKSRTSRSTWLGASATFPDVRGVPSEQRRWGCSAQHMDRCDGGIGGIPSISASNGHHVD